ncbi:MAG: DPP IV N-terminal domain-containing protein [Zavarzinella sp.]
MYALFLTLAVGADPVDWAKQESTYLQNIRQLTSEYVRAGEGYFSPDGKQIVFQAEEKDTGNPFYQIFVQDLATGKARRVSPGVGRTTCAYFSPDGKKLLFASSHLDPDAKKHQEAEYRQRADDAKKGIRRRYAWDFDTFMDIFEYDLATQKLVNLTNSPGYDAEGAYSHDGKKIVFASKRSGHMELYVMNSDGKNVKKITNTPDCYNGGPFLSPNGKLVVFRSDRKEKDRLQLYVIDLDGKNEKPLTNDDQWVYWAPYWYQDNQHIIYTAADHSNPAARPNYDLYWMDITKKSPVRITFAPGQDVLPVFSPDYKKVMWTSSRDGRSPTQLYLADFVKPE